MSHDNNFNNNDGFRIFRKNKSIGDCVRGRNPRKSRSPLRNPRKSRSPKRRDSCSPCRRKVSDRSRSHSPFKKRSQSRNRVRDDFNNCDSNRVSCNSPESGFDEAPCCGTKGFSERSDYGGHGSCGGCGKCNKCDSCKKQKSKWPPNCRKEVGSKFRLHTIFVPSKECCDIDEALCSMKNDEEGYHVILKSGSHTINENFCGDVKTVRITGDLRAFNGVGYIHKMGQWCNGRQFDQQYCAKVGGLGPWCLNISKCGDCISVSGIMNPNYDGVRKGDRLVFQYKDGKQTEHCICRGSNNTLFLEDQLCMNEEIEAGEGFFIKPCVTISTCKSRIVTNQNRFEWGGIHFDTEETFTTGSTGGFTEIEHSVMCGNMIHVGHKDWYKPNVTTGQLFNAPAFTGTAWYQTILGPRAFFEYNSSASEDLAFTIVSLAAQPLKLRNGARVSVPFGDFFSNVTGARLEGGSVLAVPGARFMSHSFQAVLLTNNSTITGDPPFGANSDPTAPRFENNTVALELAHGASAVFQSIIVNANTNDISMDTAFPDTPPGFLSHLGALSTLQPVGAKVPTGSGASTITYLTILPP